MVELTHSRQGLPEQRWRDSEAVACQLLEDGSQRGQGTSAPRLHEDAKRAAHRQAARLGDPTAHAFVNEEQFRVEPLCEQDGRRVSRVQAQIGRGHLVVDDAQPSSTRQGIQAGSGRALVDDFCPDRVRDHDLPEEDLQSFENPSTREVDERRGVSDDDHGRRRARSPLGRRDGCQLARAVVDVVVDGDESRRARFGQELVEGHAEGVCPADRVNRSARTSSTTSSSRARAARSVVDCPESGCGMSTVICMALEGLVAAPSAPS